MTALALAGLTASAPPADEIELTSGRTVRGVVQEETDQSLVLLGPGLNRVTLRRAAVATIRRQTPAENARLMGTLFLEHGMLWEAVTHLTDAIELGAEAAEVAQPLLANPTATASLLERLPPDQAAEVRNFTLQVLRAVPQSDDVLHLAGRVCEVTGDRARARDAYDRIAESWWHAHPEASADAARFYQAEARQALDGDDFGGVLDALEHLSTLDPRLAAELRPVYTLRWANGLIDQGQWGRAIELVGESVLPQAPEIGRLWLESVFSELEHRPTSTAALAEAVPIIARLYPRYFPEGAVEHIAQLYLRLGDAHMESGEFNAARAAYNQHYSLINAESNHRPKVVEATLRERAADLAPDDWDGHVRLTLDLIDHGLLDAALDQIDLLVTAPDATIREFAVEQRRAIQGRIAQEEFAQAMERYTAGDYTGALDLLTERSALFQEANLGNEVEQLRRMCMQRMEEEPNRRAIAALALYQRAERQFFSGQYLQAVSLLEGLLRDYPDAPIVPQTQNMLRMARQYRLVREPDEGPIEITAATRAAQATPATPEDSEEAQRRELEEMLEAAASVAATMAPPAQP